MNHHPSVETLRELVSINSVNPTYNGPGEAGYADYLERRCRANGIKTTRVKVLSGRDNLIMEARCGHAENVLLFESHMDTVSVQGMDAPFDPVIRDGKMLGRGSCDTKATLAGMLYALEYAAQHPEEFACDIVLAATIDEEHGFAGALHLAKNLQQIEGNITGAVIGEPTEMNVVIAHKGVCRFAVETHGVAAHTAVPDQGKNAISAMRKVLSFFEDHYFPRLKHKNHVLCGQATGVVSMINGGVQINMVPPSCEIQIDRRVLPGENSTEVFVDIKNQLAEYLKDQQVSYEVRELLLDAALNTAPDAAISQAAAQTAAELQLNPDLVGVPYGTDASKLQHEAGLPGIVFGPGTINVAHTPHECVPIDEVEQAAEFYLRLAKNFGRTSKGA
jgi:acetylornithine deacetylase